MLHKFALPAFRAETSFVERTRALLVNLTWLSGLILDDVAEQAFFLFWTVAVLFEPFANGHLVLDVRVEERTVLVVVPALALHPVDAYLALRLRLVGPSVDGLLDVLHLFHALGAEAVVGVVDPVWLVHFTLLKSWF